MSWVAGPTLSTVQAHERVNDGVADLVTVSAAAPQTVTVAVALLVVSPPSHAVLV